MSVKKSLVLAAAGIASLGASVAALAGGPEVPPAPVWHPYVYIEANLGYAAVNWSNFIFTPFVPATKNRRGGFTISGVLGYMFTPHLGLEGGWVYLPKVQGFAGLAPFGIAWPFTPGRALQLSSWFAYIAGKFVAPIYAGLNVFGKVGIAYRNLRYTGPGAAGIGTNGYWTPVFAAGLLYQFNPNWMVNFQYMYLPSYRKFFGNAPPPPTARRAPTAQLFTLGIAYAFSI